MAWVPRGADASPRRAHREDARDEMGGQRARVWSPTLKVTLRACFWVGILKTAAEVLGRGQLTLTLP
jgi:hypothetical protein